VINVRKLPNVCSWHPGDTRDPVDRDLGMTRLVQPGATGLAESLVRASRKGIAKS
jgi:hypothetical protein